MVQKEIHICYLAVQRQIQTYWTLTSWAKLVMETDFGDTVFNYYSQEESSPYLSERCFILSHLSIFNWQIHPNIEAIDMEIKEILYYSYTRNGFRQLLLSWEFQLECIQPQTPVPLVTRMSETHYQSWELLFYVFVQWPGSFFQSSCSEEAAKMLVFLNILCI